MNWFTNLFKKKEPVQAPSLLAFTVEKVVDPETNESTFLAGLNLKDGPGFGDFLRNSDYEIDPKEYSDQELAHFFVYQYCQRWIIANMKKPIFIETHMFPGHGEIKYDRVWNSAFIGAVTNLGFDQLPPSEGELAEMYMNYIYGTRLMEEMEAMEAANPTSVAHPELQSPAHTFKV
jgi:hypothetical protein